MLNLLSGFVHVRKPKRFSEGHFGKRNNFLAAPGQSSFLKSQTIILVKGTRKRKAEIIFRQAFSPKTKIRY